MNRFEELARLRKLYKEHKIVTFEMITHNIDQRVIRERRRIEQELREQIKNLERVN